MRPSQRPAESTASASVARSIKRMVTTALLVYLGFGAYLYAFQRNILYFPSAHYEVEHLAKLWLENEGEKLLVWAVNAGRSDAILYFGGNAEAVVHNAGEFASLFPDHTIYLVNYRGYGGSSGKPSEAAFYSDAVAVYDRIAARHDRVSAIGRSLGSGIGVHLATERKIDKLALITPYDSIAAVAQSKYPVYPIALMLKDRFDAVEKAPQVQAETLLLIAAEDRLIEPEHALRLGQALPPTQRRIHTLAGADHVSISEHADYARLLSAFIDSPDAK